MASPYDILGIDSDADEETIKQAYVRRVKETHPDHGGSTRAFQSVRAAYEALLADGRRDGRGYADIETSRPAEGEGVRESRVEYLNYEVLDDYGWNLDTEKLFETATTEDLDPDDYGRIVVETDESLLEAAENRGFTWPYACRGGACANCAVAVIDGELSMPVNHILPAEMLDRGIRLSCVGTPITETMQVVFNVKHLPELDELRLPPGPFESAQSSD